MCLLGLSAANPSIADLEEVILVAAELLLVGLEGSPFFLLLHMLFGRNGYNTTKIFKICVKLNNNHKMYLDPKRLQFSNSYILACCLWK